LTHNLRRWGDAPARWSSRVRRLVSPPVFLTIRWQLAYPEQGTNALMEATLCLAHRREVALEYPSARGCGQFGNSCDFCEGRGPRTI